MKSYLTSYNGLFARRSQDAPVVDRIEIPIIQRDYAQGRDGYEVARIRSSFLDVLYDAVITGMPISLDFVYGDVVSGTLRPLDGQQRLTTMFLLHWYLAWRADRLEQESGWKRFSYATRPSARRFCECLADSKPLYGRHIRAWFEDQHWFLHTWQHDPTIQSMLVMIEAIHDRFLNADCAAAWARLVDPDEPAITLHVLPIEEMGLSEDLYIKMNSRGKPLTPFENFKARFEKVLEISCAAQVDEFAKKVDGEWADLLWPYRGSDDIVDDEFLRYFQFVTDICEWRDGGVSSGDISLLAERVFGPGNGNATSNLEFLIQCFDTWIGEDIDSFFSEVFTLTPARIDSVDTSKVVLFGVSGGTSVNLFSSCCLGQVRLSWPRTILLYAVLLHRLHATIDFPRRLRVLRNLIEASSSELRADKMPALLSDVYGLIVEGALDRVSAFNQAQVSDEKFKVELLTNVPELAHHLFHLEDHPLLRGSLAVFDLDEAIFERRARAFHEVFSREYFPLLTGALLSAGDYSRSRNGRFFQFGSGSNSVQWRELFTGASRLHLSRTRDVLGQLLDAVAMRNGDVRSALESFAFQWIDAKVVEGTFDWRWYFVKYPAMRSGLSGIYVGANGSLGYRVCMLDKSQMNSWYRDAYLSAIYRECDVRLAVDEPWFTGYETEPRWMLLKASGTGIQCVPDGFLLRAPAMPVHADVFSSFCVVHGIGPDLLLKIPQNLTGGRLIDTQDRILLGSTLLRDLVKACL